MPPPQCQVNATCSLVIPVSLRAAGLMIRLGHTSSIQRDLVVDHWTTIRLFQCLNTEYNLFDTGDCSVWLVSPSSLATEISQRLESTTNLRDSDNMLLHLWEFNWFNESPSHVSTVCKLEKYEKKAPFLPGHKERVVFVSFTITVFQFNLPLFVAIRNPHFPHHDLLFDYWL